MQESLKAVAKLTNTDVNEAAKVVRKHPLLGDEIHIEEELINLEEALESYHRAAASLKNYPKMRRHVAIECQQVLKHCIGLVDRMIKGQELPHSYSSDDTAKALKNLTRLIVKDALKANRQLNDRTVEAIKPFMNLRQRLFYSKQPLFERFDVRPLLRKIALA